MCLKRENYLFLVVLCLMMSSAYDCTYHNDLDMRIFLKFEHGY